jgi:ribosomal protein S12 methylthiotransferase accessory factor
MKREMIITLQGGLKVDAEYKGFTIKTDQPKHQDGKASSPAPFDLFLASIGTCAGIYIVFFCKERKIPYENIRMVMRTERNIDPKTIDRFLLDIQLPTDFPDKYRNALIRSVNLCSVKKTIEAKPKFVVTTLKP